MESEEVDLGKRLQLARKRAGLTQQQLCQQIELSYSTLTKIERGAIAAPSVFTVDSIAKAVGVPIQELLGAESSRSLGKKTSRTGVKFVYFDVSGVLTNFSHKIFADIARDAGLPIDTVEAIYWRHNDQLNRAEITLSQLDSKLGQIFSIKNFSWERYYFAHLTVLPQGRELFEWASQNYEVGLLSNHVFLEKMQQKGLIPSDGLGAVVDSSKVGAVKPEAKIFKIAQKQAGLEPNELLLIDNERANLIAADKLGWQSAWFDDFHANDSVDRIKKFLEF